MDNEILINPDLRLSDLRTYRLFKHSGLLCLVQLTHYRYYCGYVGVDKTHELHGKEYEDIYMELNIHGGITFTGNDILEKDIFDDIWWLGFDCSHSCDLPVMFHSGNDLDMGMGYSSPRSFNYVESEVKNMAEQLANYNTNTK